MAGNPNFDAILSTTLNEHRRSIEDNIFDAMPLMFWITQRSGMKRLVNGGAKIVEPLLIAKNSTVKTYSGYETLDVTPQEGITAAEFQWKQLAGSITISREEERKNSGEKALLSLLDTKVMQAEMSMADKFSTMFFADGTGNFGKDYLGLDAIVSITPTTGTLGGIDRSDSDNAFWRNHAADGGKTTTAFDNLIAKMTTAYNTISKGNNHPDFAVSDQTTFEGYESLLVDNKRFRNEEVGDAGFENLRFKGLTIMFDDACINHNNTALGRMYFLNSKNLYFVVDTETDFLTTNFVRPENQDAKTAQILHMGQLTVNNCERQGVLFDID